MMLIVAGVMIGLCLAIMEGSVKKAQKHMKGQSIDKQPPVKVGDRVRITQSYSFYSQPGTCGVVVHTHSTTNSFEMKTDTSYGTLSIAEVCGDKWELLQPTKEQTMTQQTHKVGDRVKLMRDISSQHYYSYTNVGMTGRVTGKEHPNGLIEVAWDNLGGRQHLVHAKDLDLSPKTLNDLVEGDVVVDKDVSEDTMTVAHVLKPGLYVMLDDDEEPWLYTAKELENLEYIPQQDPKNDKTRLTVAEVAKKLGLNPDTLHIVADKKAA